MKRVLISILMFGILIRPSTVHADLFGGDVAVLTQILVQAVQQLVELKKVVDTGQDSLSLMREINQGIDQALGLYYTIFPNADPGIYREWQKAEEALQMMGHIYGIVVPSKDQRLQQDADRSATEAISLNNAIYKYTREIDEVGKQIQQHALSTSPKGAQRLTAQSMGIMVNVMNQMLRAQATGLKLQAQTLAIQNHENKEQTAHQLSTSRSLHGAMKNQDVTFGLPRF